MTQNNPGKDTREQARAALKQWERRIASSPGDPIAPARLEWLTAVIDRARREGMEEAAGILRRHWLAGIECNHETKKDHPMCACSEVDLGWHDSVGEAVERWIIHVQAVAIKAGETTDPKDRAAAVARKLVRVQELRLLWARGRVLWVAGMFVTELSPKQTKFIKAQWIKAITAALRQQGIR